LRPTMVLHRGRGGEKVLLAPLRQAPGFLREHRYSSMAPSRRLWRRSRVWGQVRERRGV